MVFKSKLGAKVFHTSEVDFGYTEPTDHYTQIVWRVYYLFFIPIWCKTILIESVPNWAIIQRAFTGYTDWKSSKPELIDEVLKAIKK